MKILKKVLLALLIIVLILAVAAGGLYIWQQNEIKNAPDPRISAESYSSEIFGAMKKGMETGLLSENGISGGRPLTPENEPRTDEGKLLYDYCFSSVDYQLTGDTLRDGKNAEQKIRLSWPELSDFAEGMNEQVNSALSERAEAASRPEEIYNEDRSFKTEILNEIYSDLFNSRLSGEKKTESREFSMKLNYSKKIWHIENPVELREGFLSWSEGIDYDAEAEKIRSQALSELTYIPVPYKIEETALRGPVPDQSRFVTTDDPAEIDALLQTEEAKTLIGDRDLVWNSGIERIPKTPIRCYLDETLLVICWQQVEAQAVGTYSEVITADGSQLRRRIAGDAFEDANHKTTSEFAADCNAVLTLGGDFYHHGRNCGIVVINRQIYRFDPSSCDCCYITGDGDMVFSYRNQFSTQEEAQAYVDENDILFSLCFGPVLIDEWEDKTPEYYPWGEINDTYARSALGLIDEHHYLTLNINCKEPGYYYLATLRNASDAMLRAGCRKAYALDGGQTATTVFNNELINPVQFGWEKPISDVIYFATALPEK